MFWGSKITADSGCSHEIKRHLLPGRKAMTNLDSILKIRDITLLTKVHLVKAMVLPVVMYRCESWTINKAECWRIYAFKLILKTLESPLDSKAIKEVNSKEINSEYSLKGLMLKLKLQYIGHLMGRADSLEKTLMLGKIDGWMASLTQRTWVWTIFGRWWRTGKPGVLQSMGSKRVGYDWVTEQQQAIHIYTRICSKLVA